jgi:PAS domain S-box-containing protein
MNRIAAFVVSRFGQLRRPSRAATRITLLVLAAFLPLFVLNLYFMLQVAREQRTHIQHDVEQDAFHMSQVVAGDLDVGRAMAQALVEMPILRGQDRDAIASVLQSLLDQHPGFAAVWATDSDGLAYANASSIPGAGAAAPVRGAALQEAIASGRTVLRVDDPDLIAMGAVAVVVMPRENAKSADSVQIALSLGGLREFVEHADLSPKAVVVVWDGEGAVVVYIAPQGTVPQGPPPVGISNENGEGAWENSDPDGVRRLSAMRALSGTDWQVTTGLPATDAWSPIRLTIVRGLGLVLATVFVAAWFVRRGKRLADQVETGHRRLQGVIARAPEGVLISAPDGRVLTANSALELLLGTRVQAGMDQRVVLADNLTWLKGETCSPWAALPFERVRQGETIEGEQLVVQRPDGSRRDLLFHALPLRDARGTTEETLTIASDITSLKDLERAKDLFVSVAVHELRTPLTVLRGYGQLLAQDAQARGWDEEDSSMLTSMNEQTERLVLLTRRLLDVSRMELGRLEVVRQPIDLVTLAREVCDGLKVAHPERELTVEAPQPETVGEWDGEMLRQVLNNLLNNAIKYAPDGQIAVHISQQDEQATVSINDQGAGIPPEHLPHLFERFRQVAAKPEQRAGGLGLGLYLCKGIIEAHGGHVGVRSQVGQGTTFWFTLPLAMGSADEKSTA